MSCTIPLPKQPYPIPQAVPKTLTQAWRLHLLRTVDQLTCWAFFVLAKTQHDSATQAVLTDLQAVHERLDQAMQRQRQARQE